MNGFLTLEYRGVETILFWECVMYLNQLERHMFTVYGMGNSSQTAYIERFKFQQGNRCANATPTPPPSPCSLAGNPINPASGTKYDWITDISYKNLGHDLSFKYSLSLILKILAGGLLRFLFFIRCAKRETFYRRVKVRRYFIIMGTCQLCGIMAIMA